MHSAKHIRALNVDFTWRVLIGKKIVLFDVAFSVGPAGEISLSHTLWREHSGLHRERFYVIGEVLIEFTVLVDERGPCTMPILFVNKD